MATPTIGTTNGGPSIASTALQSLQQKIAAQKAAWEQEAVDVRTAAYAAVPTTQKFITQTEMTKGEFAAIQPNPGYTSEDLYTVDLKTGPFEIIADATKIILRQHLTKGYQVKKDTFTSSTLGSSIVTPATSMFMTAVRGIGGTYGLNSTPVSQSQAMAYIEAELANIYESFTNAINPSTGAYNIAEISGPYMANTFGSGAYGYMQEWSVDIWHGVYNQPGVKGTYSGRCLVCIIPITPAHDDTYWVTNVMDIMYPTTTVDQDYGYRDFTLSLSGITNNTTGQTQTRAPSSPATNPSRPSGRGAGRRPGSTNSGGSGTGFQSGGGTFYNSSTGTWGTQVISNDTISSSPYTDPIDGLNTSTNNDLTTSLPLTIPGNSFLIQSGSLGEIYPTYEGAYVWDIALKKWGKYKGQYKTLIDYSPINSGLNGAINYSNFGMHAGILDPLGKIYLFDTWPDDSWIRYGKAGYYRLGLTEALEVKVHFRTLDTDCVLRVDSSMNGRDIDPTLSTGVNILNENDYTFKFKTNGRWFYINLFGHWDLQFLELRGNITGRR